MGKPPRLYSESVAKEIGSELDHLTQNPKGLQVKELVFQMQSKIEAAQASGHTLNDIVNVFKDKGVDLTLNTLKQYLRESRALNPRPDPPKLPASDPKPTATKSKKPDVSPPLSPPPQSSQEATQLKPDKLLSKTEGDSKPPFTNTNDDGFQEMRDDNDL